MAQHQHSQPATGTAVNHLADGPIMANSRITFPYVHPLPLLSIYLTKYVQVQTCDKDNAPLVSFQETTGCNAGGTSYSCANNSPWAVNDTFSYGFVGAFMKNNTERDWCCGCYALTFTTGPVKGKSMIVQAHNTDYEMQDQNIFTFAVSFTNKGEVEDGIVC